MKGHRCSMNELQKRKVEEARTYWLNHVPGSTSKTPKPEKPANSNDFVFDRKTLTITKKENKQLTLLGGAD